MTHHQKEEEVTDKILTLPNVITLVRFLLIPLFLFLLFGLHKHGPALVVFVIAACTDWVDGQVARHTHQVSKLGKVFDPLVDRFLLASGVIAVCLLGRIPLWIVIVLIIRDLAILIEGRIELHLMNWIPPVSYIGKFATAFLMVGFSFLLLGTPYVDGLGIVEISWLPGLGNGKVLVGTWFVYLGLIFSLTVFCIYQYRGITSYAAYRREHQQGN